MRMGIKLKPIGAIHSPFKEKVETPIQPFRSRAIGEIKVFEEFAEGLQDIEKFSHIIILYLFHKSNGFNLLVKPFMDNDLRGLFATRHPARPNPIGLSVVELIGRKGSTLRVKGIDVIDGTPLLDIKPFVPAFDNAKNVNIGWLEKRIKGGFYKRNQSKKKKRREK